MPAIHLHTRARSTAGVMLTATASSLKSFGDVSRRAVASTAVPNASTTPKVLAPVATSVVTKRGSNSNKTMKAQDDVVPESHLISTVVALRPLPQTPWHVLSDDQAVQLATQRKLLVAMYRRLQRQVTGVHDLLRLGNVALQVQSPPAAPSSPGKSKLTVADRLVLAKRHAAWERHAAPLVRALFTQLVDSEALFSVLAARAPADFLAALDGVVAAAEKQSGSALVVASPGKSKAAVAAAAQLAATRYVPSKAETAAAHKLLAVVVRSLFQWEALLAQETLGSVRRSELAAEESMLRSTLATLTSTTEIVTKSVCLSVASEQHDATTPRVVAESDESFDARVDNLELLLRNVIRHNTRRLVAAHEALQAAMESGRRVTALSDAARSALDVSHVQPAGSPYQFTTTAKAEPVSVSFRQTQLALKAAFNETAPAAKSAATGDATVAASSSEAPALDTPAGRLAALLARAARNKAAAEAAKAAGRAAPPSSTATSTGRYHENAYDFWTLPTVDTTLSAVVEPAPLSLLSQTLRESNVPIAYFPLEVDREDDVNGVTAAARAAAKATTAAATPALKGTTATTPAAAPATTATSTAGDVAPMPTHLADALGRVSLLGSIAKGREPLFMRTHINRYRKLPLPLEFVQAVQSHAALPLLQQAVKSRKAASGSRKVPAPRVAPLATTAAGAPATTGKTSSSLFAPLSAATLSRSAPLDVLPKAALNLAGNSAEPNHHGLVVRIVTRRDSAAAQASDNIDEKAAEALGEWSVLKAPSMNETAAAAAEMLAEHDESADAEKKALQHQANFASVSSQTLTLQNIDGKIKSASSRLLSMNHRQTRAAMEAATFGETAENSFFRALLPGASVSAASDAAHLEKFRYRVEMTNTSRSHSVLMLSRRWQFIGCTGMREVVGPGFAGSCPLILPGSTHVYESSAIVPLLRAARAASTSAPAMSSSTSSSDLQCSRDAVEEFAAHNSKNLFGAASHYARQFGGTVGWMQGAFQFLSIDADTTFSQAGVGVLKQHAAKAGKKGGASIISKFVRKHAAASGNNNSTNGKGAKTTAAPRLMHIAITPTALDPAVGKYQE